MAISKLRRAALEAEQHLLSNAVGPPVHKQTPGAECLPGDQSQGFGHRAARAACRARNGVLFLCDQTRNNVEWQRVNLCAFSFHEVCDEETFHFYALVCKILRTCFVSPYSLVAVWVKMNYVAASLLQPRWCNTVSFPLRIKLHVPKIKSKTWKKVVWTELVFMMFNQESAMGNWWQHGKDFVGICLDDRKQWGASWLLFADPMSSVPLCSAPVRGAEGLPKQNQEGAGARSTSTEDPNLISIITVPRWDGRTGGNWAAQSDSKWRAWNKRRGNRRSCGWCSSDRDRYVDRGGKDCMGYCSGDRSCAVPRVHILSPLSLGTAAAFCSLWQQSNIFIHVKKYCCFLLSTIMLLSWAILIQYIPAQGILWFCDKLSMFEESVRL